MAMLVAEHVGKSYALPGGETLPILRDCSLALEQPSSAAILGPSGSGKSTLLAILGTLEKPSAGRVVVEGIDPAGLDERRLADFRGRHLGFVFQDHLLLPQCTVVENVLAPLLAVGAAGTADVGRAEALLARVGLAHRLHHRPAQLSGGERQRAAIARALIREPAVVLADEPTGNLDRATAGSVADLLLELQRERRAILIVVTHSQLLAQRMDLRFELNEGRLVPCP